MGMLPMSIQVMFPTEFDWAVGTGIPLSLIEMLLLYVPAVVWQMKRSSFGTLHNSVSWENGFAPEPGFGHVGPYLTLL